MKKVLLISVNYNSYDKLKIFLKSVADSIRLVNGDFQCDVNIVDNSTEREKVRTDEYNIEDKLSISIIDSENLGYFGSALKIYNKYGSNVLYDYIFITNVDLQVNSDFFTVLNSLNINENVAWIAPSIFSKFENRDKNPQRLNRCSKKKLELLYLLYSFPLLERIYSNVIYPKKKAKNYERELKQSQKIYCGHGSFIILTKAFVRKKSTLNYPCFLFCEELFLGETIKNIDLDVIYEPRLKIIDDEHVSTGKLQSKKFYKYNKESISWILETFYK